LITLVAIDGFPLRITLTNTFHTLAISPTFFFCLTSDVTFVLSAVKLKPSAKSECSDTSWREQYHVIRRDTLARRFTLARTSSIGVYKAVKVSATVKKLRFNLARINAPARTSPETSVAAARPRFFFAHLSIDQMVEESKRSSRANRYRTTQ